MSQGILDSDILADHHLMTGMHLKSLFTSIYTLTYAKGPGQTSAPLQEKPDAENLRWSAVFVRDRLASMSERMTKKDFYLSESMWPKKKKKRQISVSQPLGLTANKFH